MQPGGARGALAVLAAVLGVSVSLFRLVPEVSQLDLDDVARVVYWVSSFLAIVCIYFWLIGRFISGRLRRGTLAASQVLFWTAAAWVIAAGLLLVLFAPSLTDIDAWNETNTATARNWIAALSPAIFAAGGYVAYRTWMSYRPEREQQCPWCREWVKLDARRCRYCGSDLGHQERRQPEPRDAPQPAKAKRRAKRQPAS
jgi:hypothetical protein